MPMCQLISNASFAIFHWTLISCLLYKMKMKKKGSGMGNLFDEKLSSMLLCWWALGLHLGGIKLSSEHQYAAPWVVSLCLVMTNSLLDPSTITTLFYDSIWFISFNTIICLSIFSCELWNRKLKINEICLCFMLTKLS